MIRKAIPDDKDIILNFCQDTFSWGDYISEIWDFWINEGFLLVCTQNHIPVGMCHLSFLKNSDFWIEGIRIDHTFRRKKIATNLILESEKIARNNDSHLCMMLIDAENIPSLNLAKNLKYVVDSTWYFYILKPTQCTLLSDKIIDIKKPEFIQKTKCRFLVDSWRWIFLNNSIITELINSEKILYSEDEQSIAIIMNSKHFENTVIVTLYNFGQYIPKKLLSHIQTIFAQKQQRIQILTESCISDASVEYKLSFRLMKKSF